MKNFPLERPQIKLKIELSTPLPEGAPPRKFSVSRTLKAKWDEDPNTISKEILNEIKNYKGSFIGDIILSLHSLVKSDGQLFKEEGSRSIDIARYASALIDSLVFLGIKDKIHEELLENQEIPEWDGTQRDIGPINPDELKEADVEKIMTLLIPKIKHALFLISKDIKDEKG